LKKGNGLAVVLIVIGILLLFGKLGHLFGFIISLLVPVLVIGLGVMAWQRGNRIVGGVLAVIGGFMLLGKLSAIIFWIAVIGLIVFGISMLGKKSARP
jgi:lia operon protein LiaI